MEKTGKIGVIDVGGGLRGIYGAGVFDYCLDEGISFDYCLGVSAGSANIGSYLSRQRGRNYRFYHDYAFRKQYMSMRNLLRRGSYINMEYIYRTIAGHDGEDPYDFETARASGVPMLCVAMDARSGRPVYFTTEDMAQDDYFAFKASCCIPLLNRPYMVGRMPCYDGGACNPIPIKKALRDGCGRVVVILTKPVGELLDPRADRLLARLLARRFPAAAASVRRRAALYNRQLALCKEYEKEGRVLLVAPDSTCGMKTLTKDPEALERLYRMGYADGKKIRDFVENTGKTGDAWG